MISKRSSLFAKYGALILFLFGLAAPLVLMGAVQTIRSNTNKVADWLPETYSETGDLRWFRQHFVADQFVIVSWEGCQLGENPASGAAGDDPRIEELAQLLVPTKVTADAASSVLPKAEEYFKAVTTGRRLLDRLTADPTNVPYAIALRRLQGSLIGDDGRQTCVVVTLTDEAVTHLREVLGRPRDQPLRGTHTQGLLFDALAQCGIPAEQVHLGGPPVDNVAIDEEGEQTMVRLAGLAALFGILLAWWSLRSVALTAIVFACGIFSAAASLAVVSWTGATSDAVLLSMPSLIYVLAISGAVHLINYYRTAVAEHGLHLAPERAIARGWKPAFLCSVTTALGLLSLCTSDLTPISKFGFYSAIGIMQTLVVLFLFLPAALEAWPMRKPQPANTLRVVEDRPPRSLGRMKKRMAGGIASLWHQMGGGIIRHHGLVTAVCVAVIAFIGYGITKTDTSVDLMKLFDQQAKVVQDYRWLERNVGRLVPMEIVVRFHRDSLHVEDANHSPNKLSLLQRLRVVSQVQRAIEKEFGQPGRQIVGPSMAATTFVPPLPSEKRGTLALLRRTATNSKFEQSYPALLNSGYLVKDHATGDELWRISVRVAAFEDVDYGHFSGQLKQIVDPIVAQHSGNLASLEIADTPIKAVYTGVVPIVYKAQRALLESLVESTLWSFMTITPLLMIVSRGVRAGLVTMLPNVLPILVVFGGMGWLGLPIDIGSMMSASIALGVAVDDTIHYLSWFRESFDESGDRKGAILAAYEHCATPTLQAALINGLGLSVFAFSTFTPTRQFGVLMLVILLAGVVAELILLPALLAGPLGTVFKRRKRREVDPVPIAVPAPKKSSARAKAV